MKSRCFRDTFPLAFLAKSGRGLSLTPLLNGPLPLVANGLAEGPEVLPNEEKGSDGWVCTRPWVDENALLELSLRKGVAVPACHHDADVDWSSAVLMASEIKKIN